MMSQQQIDVRQRFSKVMSTCSILSALFVVWIHAYNVEVYGDSNRVIYWIQDVISQGIARGAVPFFLMSSAFFLYSKDKRVADVYRSRGRSVLLPYLLWNAVYMIVFAVLRHLSLTSVGMDVITVGNVLRGLLLHKYNYAYWFMRDLIVLVALYPLIRWVLRRGKVVALVGFAALVTAYYCGAEFLSSAIYYFIGASIGYFFSDGAVALVDMKKKTRLWVIVGCLALAALTFWLKNVCKIDFVELFRDLAMAVLMFFAVSGLNLRISGKLIALSFMIYSLHPLILEIVEKLIYLYLPHTDLFMMVDYVVAPLLCLTMIFVVCLVWKKVLPRTYKVFNGGRI